MDVLPYVFKGGLTLYLIVAAVYDFRTQRVPNWLTVPPLVAILGWRVVHLEFVFLLYWAGCLAIWLLNGIGGGDAKLLMGMFGIFPRLELLYLFLIFAGVSLAVVLFVRYARLGKLKMWLTRTLNRLIALKLFPSRAEMEMAAEPFTVFISTAVIAYVWVFV